ncbi:hypothetical protein AB2M95_18080 [Pseudomonas chlororaphis]|uniref:hypothetical protein n=1 Tax=Pseudomonas chlororaphis TaxID=587753 RepID=UPI003461D167
MSKQVLYCLASGVVIEWQDTEVMAYAATAEGNSVLPVTAEQWKQKEALHYVFDGELTKVGQPPPSHAHRWDGVQWALDAEQAKKLEQEEGARLCALVDSAADKVRLVIVGDPLRTLEYERAAMQAQSFKDAGYPPKAVPLSVSAWAVKGRTVQEAAEDILRKSAEFNDRLLALRTLRLKAKEKIRAHVAKGKMEQARAVADGATQAIHNCVQS